MARQPGTSVYASDLDADDVRRTLAEATSERQPNWRGTQNSPGSFDRPA